MRDPDSLTRMLLSEFDFPFDPSLVATEPVIPRDHARLLVVDRHGGPVRHQRVADLPQLLKRGDLLVVNDTKVLAARMMGRKRPGGGVVELLFVREIKPDLWEVLMRGTCRPGQIIDLDGDARAHVVERGISCVVRIESACPVRELFQRAGHMPLPPYIKRSPTDADRLWYQTLFAREDGAIAAPTAGLHFTPRLIEALRGTGVQLATITLHVGLGTFKPVTAERIEEHRMDAEVVEVPAQTVHMIRETKAAGSRVVAVGTTTVRALESAAKEEGALRPFQGNTNLFVVPGYAFRVVDALMTNFHHPRTTLLMLVSALTGVERLREAYRTAIEARYRFYSYGDAMLIL